MENVMKTGRTLIGILALALAAGMLQSCNNPFGTAASGSRFTPRISHLSASRSSVYAGVPFTLSFEFNDPQNDIATVNVTMIGTSNSGMVQQNYSWDDTTQVTHTETSPGTATVSVTFAASNNDPEGAYTIKLTVTDEKDHVSNILEGDIDLL
jgi:hypothetical protein